MTRLLALAFAVSIVAFAAPAAAAPPLLVVYPFAQSDGVPDGMGAAVADRISAEITSAGGITVIKAPADTKPVNYRKVARDLGAEVYYSGSIVPVGTSYSAIEQLVSTKAGMVRWSVTMQFHAIGDIHGEGVRVHDALLQQAPPPSIPTPSP
jgi:TolB-like protein